MSLPNSSAQEAVSRREARRLPARRRSGRCGCWKRTSVRRDDPDAQGVRERDHRRHRARRLDQRRAASAGDRARGARAARARRLHADRQARAGARRPAAERQVPDVGTDRDRRHSAADEDAARRGLLHGDCMTVTGQTLARESGERRPVSRRARTSCVPLRRPDQAGQPSRRPVRQPGARRRGREDHRQGRRWRSRARARVFDGEEQCLQAILDGRSRAGRRRRHPLRRTERRARHARDAEPDQRRSWAAASATRSR